MAKDQTITLTDPHKFLLEEHPFGGFGEYKRLQMDADQSLYSGYYWPRQGAFHFIVNQVILAIPIVGLVVILIMYLTKPLRKHQGRVQLAPVSQSALLPALEKRYVLRDLYERTQGEGRSDDSRLSLSICEEWIGDALLRLGRPAQALSHFEEARKIREALASGEPGNTEKQRVLQLIKNREAAARAQTGQVQSVVAGTPSQSEIDRVIEGAKRPFEERVELLNPKDGAKPEGPIATGSNAAGRFPVIATLIISVVATWLAWQDVESIKLTGLFALMLGLTYLAYCIAKKQLNGTMRTAAFYLILVPLSTATLIWLFGWNISDARVPVPTILTISTVFFSAYAFRKLRA